MIVQSAKLSKKQKYKCVITGTDEAVISNNKVTEFVVAELLASAAYTVSKSLQVDLLLSKSINTNSRILLFHKDTKLLDEIQIEDFLNSLGKDYEKITDKSRQAILPKTSMNEILLEDLKQRKYISSYTSKNNNLRVYHFRGGS